MNLIDTAPETTNLSSCFARLVIEIKLGVVILAAMTLSRVKVNKMLYILCKSKVIRHVYSMVLTRVSKFEADQLKVVG